MNKILIRVAKIANGLIIAVIFTIVVLIVFVAGYVKGYKIGVTDITSKYENFLANKVSSTSIPVSTPTPPAPTPKIVYVEQKSATQSTWGGPQLWDAVNAARVQHGVNPLKVADNLCTISSIRLNELLQLGTLDGHVGFSALEQRSDIKPIFDSYSTVSEFLVSGASSPQNAVDLWYNTLGHKELITGGQYVWGCIYAQNGFGVAITAF